MRGFFFTILAVLTIGWLGSSVELPQAWSSSDAAEPASRRDDSAHWRRTARGWEKREDWTLPGQSADAVRLPMTVHPVAIATLQGVVAVIALGLAEQAPGCRGSLAA